SPPRAVTLILHDSAGEVFDGIGIPLAGTLDLGGTFGVSMNTGASASLMPGRYTVKDPFLESVLDVTSFEVEPGRDPLQIELACSRRLERVCFKVRGAPGRVPLDHATVIVRDGSGEWVSSLFGGPADQTRLLTEGYHEVLAVAPGMMEHRE